VYQTGFVSWAPQEALCKAFERCRSVAEAKGHNGELLQPVAGGERCSLCRIGAGPLADCHFSGPGWKPLGSDEHIQGDVDPR
jgi:hypothetical protein